MYDGPRDVGNVVTTRRRGVPKESFSYVSFDRVESCFGVVDVCPRGGIPA